MRFYEFIVQCPNVSCLHVINYSEDIVAGQIITRLANRECQSKILAEANTLTTVEQKFHRLISLETTDTLTLHLRSSSSFHLTFSSLRSKQKCFQGEDTPKIPQNKPCDRCGKTLHSNGLKEWKNCPARTLWCYNCEVIGNLEKMSKTKDGAHYQINK